MERDIRNLGRGNDAAFGDERQIDFGLIRSRHRYFGADPRGERMDEKSGKGRDPAGAQVGRGAQRMDQELEAARRPAKGVLTWRKRD